MVKEFLIFFFNDYTSKKIPVEKLLDEKDGIKLEYWFPIYKNRSKRYPEQVSEEMQKHFELLAKKYVTNQQLQKTESIKFDFFVI